MNTVKLEAQLTKLTMQLVTDVCLLSTKAAKAERPKTVGKKKVKR
jgi:hypothetical protein